MTMMETAVSIAATAGLAVSLAGSALAEEVWEWWPSSAEKISGETVEVIHLSNRASVMHRGFLVAELSGEAIKEATILAHFFDRDHAEGDGIASGHPVDRIGARALLHARGPGLWDAGPLHPRLRPLASVEAARVSGVKITLYIVATYTACSFVAALTGVLLTARVGSGEATLGSTLMLESIAAAVIGGLLVSIFSVGMNLARIDSFLQQVLLGLVVVAAVFLDRLRLRIRV